MELHKINSELSIRTIFTSDEIIYENIEFK